MNEYSRDALYHHGVMGMKWGIRRYQPYGQGYDPKNVGKYVGDRSTKSYKKALKSLQRDKDKLEAWGARQQHFRDKTSIEENRFESEADIGKPYDQLDYKAKARRDAHNEYKSMMEDGYVPTNGKANLEKKVKTKDGSEVTISAWADSYMVDYPGQKKIAKKLEQSIDTVEKNAVKAWVDAQYDFLTKQDWVKESYPEIASLSKQELLNGLRLDKVWTNGSGFLGVKPGNKKLEALDNAGWFWPEIEFNTDTGKIVRTQVVD